MEHTQNVLVVGATGGTGRATIDALVRQGHQVTAFSRHAESLEIDSETPTRLEACLMGLSPPTRKFTLMKFATRAEDGFFYHLRNPRSR